MQVFTCLALIAAVAVLTLYCLKRGLLPDRCAEKFEGALEKWEQRIHDATTRDGLDVKRTAERNSLGGGVQSKVSDAASDTATKLIGKSKWEKASPKVRVGRRVRVH